MDLFFLLVHNDYTISPRIFIIYTKMYVSAVNVHMNDDATVTYVDIFSALYLFITFM